ncbi:hypothetical protein CHS0354_002057 [Potamilus streckersoni]|uniref:Molybdate ABC transporter substrate-binding protein n=1 Tax=Potamilus streckersoni TaxID=2493646 RepID=A0AAE0T6J0_9BIVA|nr:hypothetical protein CHS0354_002057 [Potamilus streckersoni]
MMTALTVIYVFLSAPTPGATELRIAVAANFAPVLQKLKPVFEKKYNVQTAVIYGSSGVLYAQIINGAPFDVFLAADDVYPKRLLSEHPATGKPFIYALGRLVLWTKHSPKTQSAADFLKTGNFNRLALANPRFAPYGAAGEEVLKKLRLTQATANKRVYGESISQVLQFVRSGNVQAAFLSSSQVAENPAGGYVLDIPPELNSTIRLFRRAL